MFKIKYFVPLVIAVLFSPAIFAQAGKSIKTIIVDAGHGGKDFGAEGRYEGGLGSYEKNVTLAISLKVVAELKKQLPNVKIIPTRTTDIYQSPPEKANIANDNKGDLFICIHADAVDLKTGRRQISTRVETRYKYTYTGKGKKKKKIPHPYTVVVPVYEYYKMGSERSGTSIWIFAAHKTIDKEKTVMQNEDEIQLGSGEDSAYNDIDFSTPEYRMMAKVHADRFQKKSIKLASMVNDEVAETDRKALGTFQRPKGIWVLQATNMPAILIETGFITNHDDERYLNSDKGQQELAEAIATAVKKYKTDIENANPSNTPGAPAASNNAEEKKVLNEANGLKYSNRTKTVLKKIAVAQQEFKVDLYDDGDVDGDIVSVYYNGKELLSNKKLTDKPLSITLATDPARQENELVIYAENEGSIAPNTALMVVTDGSTRTEVRVAADSKKNAVVVFTKK